MQENDVDIWLFHGRRGARRLFTFRRWMLLAPVALLAVLIAGGLLLWRFYDGYEAMVRRSGAARARLAEQKARGLALRERARRVSLEAARIRAFDAKLGIMLGVPREAVGRGSLPTAVAFPETADGRLFDFLAALDGRMAVEEVRQQELVRSLLERKLEFLATPSLWPSRGLITSGFGRRRSPFGRGGDFHNGVDIKVAKGTPVYAPGAGRVVEADFVHGYGLRVVIDHDFGLETIFAHLKKAEVTPGQMVRRGERIGLSGNSGRTTGSHLHYEVHVNGTPVDPQQYMLD